MPINYQIKEDELYYHAFLTSEDKRLSTEIFRINKETRRVIFEARRTDLSFLLVSLGDIVELLSEVL